MKPQQTTVMIVQQTARLWRIMLRYEDGEVWVSTKVYASEDEAGKAALEWALENAVPDQPDHIQ